MIHVTVADLNVIPKDFVESDLEGLDAGAFFFYFFQVGDVIARVLGGLYDLIQFGGVTRANDAGVGQGGGRFICDAFLQQGEFAPAIVDGVGFAVQQGHVTVDLLEDGRQDLERLTQSDQVARYGVLRDNAVDDAFDVGHAFKLLLQLHAVQSFFQQVFHRVQAFADLGCVDQGLVDPAADHALAHGRARLVHYTQQ